MFILTLHNVIISNKKYVTLNYNSHCISSIEKEGYRIMEYIYSTAFLAFGIIAFVILEHYTSHKYRK